ncbi:hypothetical protein [Thiohalophilus sp.]|uniref:hypothetical protein n=1 Tax=Thiohalophilus sp. TaxID=3028392 RepID=UPI0039761AB6
MRFTLSQHRRLSGRAHAPAQCGYFVVLFLFLGVLPSLLVADEQISRETYVAQSYDDLLGPCKDPAFVRCIGSSEKQCLQQVNRLVDQCSRRLPGVITTQNFDNSADEYATCVFSGLQEIFGMNSEEIGQCENRAGLR